MSRSLLSFGVNQRQGERQQAFSYICRGIAGSWSRGSLGCERGNFQGFPFYVGGTIPGKGVGRLDRTLESNDSLVASTLRVLCRVDLGEGVVVVCCKHFMVVISFALLR